MFPYLDKVLKSCEAKRHQGDLSLEQVSSGAKLMHVRHRIGSVAAWWTGVIIMVHDSASPGFDSSQFAGTSQYTWRTVFVRGFWNSDDTMASSSCLGPLYTPLEDGATRLLRVEPSTDRAAPLACKLEHVRPGESPYDALSYVWGKEDPVRLIEVDGMKFFVRPNLFDALKELRQADQATTLWVDSICINQDDLAERSQQVRVMSDIYRSATQVVIWLGKHDAGASAALHLIRGLSKLEPELVRRIQDEERLPWDDRVKVFTALGMGFGMDNYNEVVSSLHQLRDNPWWTRIWTVQEIVLARSAVLRCGAESASWEHLNTLSLFAFEIAHHNTLTIGRPMEEAIFDEVTAGVLKLYIATVSLRSLGHRLLTGSHIRLEEVLWSQVLTRQSTDPLDMIFALLGLVTPRLSISIDYRKSKKEVYSAAMRVMLEQGPHLSALHFLQESYATRDNSLPSWVPDFSTLSSFKATSLGVTGVGTSLVRRSLYHSSFRDTEGLTSPSFLESGLGTLLMVTREVLMDTVQAVGTVCTRLGDSTAQRAPKLKKTVKEWQTLAGAQEISPIEGISASEAFWRTVTFDLQLVDRDYYAGNPDRRDLLLPDGAPGMPPRGPAEEAEVLDGILDAPVPKTVLEKLRERRLFITKTGYFGLGPSLTQPEDEICILHGSMFPAVIRPEAGGHHRIVGEWSV